MKSGKSKSKGGSGKNSFIIIVGDEGGILLHLQNNQVVKRIFSQSPAKESTRNMNDAMAQFPGVPVTLLIDMMDQSYVKQTLPPVSSFNVGKIIRRRLNKDFSADDVKGYLILDREKTGRKDWNYLMVSVANTVHLQQWVDFAVERPNPFNGLVLVPLECQPMMLSFEKEQLARIGKDAKPTEWHMLINHHKVGGFRQIVFKNGQLVFTRLAQLVGEPTPEVIAGNIEQEMLNTLEYLKRLGLQDVGTLTATVIASGEIKQVFETKTVRQDQCHFYTPYEAATLLSLENVAKPEDQFADIVVAGFIGKRRKPMLRLFTPYTARIAKLVSYGKLCKLVATIAALGILGWGAMVANDWYTATTTIEDLEVTKRQLASQLATQNDKKRTLPERMNWYFDVASVYRSFYMPKYDVLYFVQRTFKAMEGSTTLNSYHWSLNNTIVNAKEEDKRTVNADFEANLIPNDDREKFVAEAQKLVDKIKKNFNDYEVTTTDLPGMLSDKEELKTVISDTGNVVSTESKAQNTTVKFTLKGPVSKLPAQPPAAQGGR